MNSTSDFDLSKILSGIYRHKGLVFAVTLVVFTLAAYLAATIPNVYRSSTLILITPQRVPSAFIHSTVTSGIQDRIHAITQEILSRTRLENIIKEFNLYPSGAAGTTMEDRVNTFRKDIRLDVRRNDGFQISYESPNPETAMKVANRLGSLFIEQNLQVREQQAVGTTTFINAETERLRKELEEQETVVTRYKVNNRFELPDQLDANLRTVEQFRSELKGNMTTLASMQERLVILQKQLLDTNMTLPDVEKNTETDFRQSLPVWQQILIRKKQLDALLVRYSEKYPEVVRLREDIRALEKEMELEQANTKEKPSRREIPDNALRQLVEEQIENLKSSINALQLTNAELKKTIAAHQQRIENTPLRAIELAKVSRTYDITNRKYQDLLAKGLESQLSENLEKKQKGEQFEVIDPANLPQAPVRPNRLLIILGGLVAGVLGGLALAFVWETFDRSFRESEDIAEFVGLPLLATIPQFLTRGAVLDRRRAQGILGLSTVGTLVMGLILIRLFGSKFF